MNSQEFDNYLRKTISDFREPFLDSDWKVYQKSIEQAQTKKNTKFLAMIILILFMVLLSGLSPELTYGDKQHLNGLLNVRERNKSLLVSRKTYYTCAKKENQTSSRHYRKDSETRIEPVSRMKEWNTAANPTQLAIDVIMRFGTTLSIIPSKYS